MWFCWDHSNTFDFEPGNSPRNYHILCYCQAQPKQLKRIRIKVHCGFRLPGTWKKRCWASTHSHLQEYQELKSNQTPQKFETVEVCTFQISGDTQIILKVPQTSIFTKVSRKLVGLKSYVLPSKTDYFKRISADSPAKKKHTPPLMATTTHFAT